ncbi:MAG: nucleotide exchange factor GrpE [Pseudonocardiales bacterium]|nr:MAG: nucleotide exchange factor GrpE [Pseudonocardiales bacterium]
MGSDEPDRVVIRDKRRIDPVTGEVRAAPDGVAAAAGAPAGPEVAVPDAVADLQAAVAERTADLQRVQAEYANYRKRADRDRLAAGDVAISRVLAELLPVLDDIDRARTHDDLTGALKAVADHLEGIFAKLGLHAFGEVGDPFDPAIHEAVLHAESDDVTEPTCTIVMRRGYQHGERLLRPAMVGVSEPPTTPDPTTATAPATSPTGDDPTEQPAEVKPEGDPGHEAQGDPEAQDE